MFEQYAVADEGDAIVTLSARCGIPNPMIIDGAVALEPDSPVVWFTFPGRWYDVGRFHRANGEFTGLYANIITPVELETRLRWRTTDLFLDLWLGFDGKLHVLDEDELRAAEQSADIQPELAAAARREIERLQEEWRRGEWPPAIVNEWTLERAQHVCFEAF